MTSLSAIGMPSQTVSMRCFTLVRKCVLASATTLVLTEQVSLFSPKFVGNHNNGLVRGVKGEDRLDSSVADEMGLHRCVGQSSDQVWNIRLWSSRL